MSDVAIFASNSIITGSRFNPFRRRAIRARAQLVLRMSFSTINGWRWYGPCEAPGDNPWLEWTQKDAVYRATTSGTWPWLDTHEGWGLLVGSTCTTQCKACFGYRTRSIPPDRHIPSVTTSSVCC